MRIRRPILDVTLNKLLPDISCLTSCRQLLQQRTFCLLPSTPLSALLISILTVCHTQAVAQTAEKDTDYNSTNKSVSDMDLDELINIRVSPFDVSISLDKGYKASNAVTGSIFDIKIQELPFAIQAFTESFIDDQQPDNLFDIARYSPGVTYRSNDFNEGNANLAIRGFAVSTTKGNTQVIHDGFAGPSIFDFTNISRVEVVKGPSSFLYGQVAPGGIVNIISKQPQASYNSYAELSYGSYDQYRLQADATGPISDTLFFRIAASYDEDIHYWEPYDAHSWDFAPSLLWQPSERISLNVKFEQFSKQESPQVMQKPGYGPQSGIVPTASDPNLSGIDFPGLGDSWNGMSNTDYRNSDSRNLSAWLDINLGPQWNLRSGYSHLDYEIDAVFTGNLGLSDNQTSLQGRRVRGQTYTNRSDTLEAHAIGNYDFDNMSLRLLLGVQYIERRFDDWAAQAANDPTLGDDPIASPLPLWDLNDPSSWDYNTWIPRSALTENATDRTTQYEDSSIYVGTTLGLLEERLLLLAGMRLTTTRNQLSDHLNSETGPHFTEQQLTPQYGVLYKLDPQLALFASYAESFLPGSQLLSSPDGSTSAAEPTQGKGFDIGIKADLLEGKLSGTLTFFDLKNSNIVTDLAHTDSFGSVVIYNVQAGEQRSQGLELDLTATLSDQWQLYLSYTYMDARITEFSGQDDAILAQDPATLDEAGLTNYRNVKRFHDARMQMSAPQLFNLWTRYNFKQAPFDGMYIAGGINYVYDQTLLPDSPTSSRQTYALINARLGYEWRHDKDQYRLSLIGKNLANEHYRPSQSTRSRPREYLLTLRIGF